MNNNNYKAPETSLIDLPAPALPERPRNVNIALVLVGAGLLIQLLAKLKYLQDSGFQVDNPVALALAGVDFAIMGVILHQLARGKRWARLVLLFIVLLNFAQQCTVVGFVWRQSPDLWASLLTVHWVLTRILPIAMNFVARVFVRSRLPRACALSPWLDTIWTIQITANLNVALRTVSKDLLQKESGGGAR